ncbi:MAG: hypothetical protein V5A44_11325 [Haloarculaceae archaeon]
MGHRALHAVPVEDGYDCVRTRWGGLAVFDGSIPDPPDARRPVAERVDAVGVLRALTDVDEALFVHGDDVAYLVRRLDVPPVAGVDPGTSVRVLLPVADGATARRLDGDLATAKGVLGDAVDAGLLARWMAAAYLRAFVARHPGVRGVIWERPERPTGSHRGKPPP